MRKAPPKTANVSINDAAGSSDGKKSKPRSAANVPTKPKQRAGQCPACSFGLGYGLGDEDGLGDGDGPVEPWLRSPGLWFGFSYRRRQSRTTRARSRRGPPRRSVRGSAACGRLPAQQWIRALALQRGNASRRRSQFSRRAGRRRCSSGDAYQSQAPSKALWRAQPQAPSFSVSAQAPLRPRAPPEQHLL